MFNFFAKEAPDTGKRFYISGADYNHIKNVLRLKEGDDILVSYENCSHLCSLENFSGDFVSAVIIKENYKSTELPVKLHLFQGLPKADKLELIIQKCTELGISEITPVEMSRCIVKLDEKKKKSKTERWQSIAESAAKQSKRNLIPKINSPLSLKEVAKSQGDFDLFLVPYENEEGMKGTVKILSKIKSGMSVGILIGPEGGFDEEEIQMLKEAGCLTLSLGKRILRTETAAITATAMCMLYCEAKSEDE